MKRHALLIGYSGWDLNGHEQINSLLDTENYKNFLMSLNGGAWLDDEITILNDKSLGEIVEVISKIKRNKYDVVFTVFSGHGIFDDEENNCRKLEVSKRDFILEKDLENLAYKQILILDSCSGLSSKEETKEVYTINDDYNYIPETSVLKNARKRYEERCLSCPAQIIKFYAAEKGSLADDTSMGGRYSQALLDTFWSAEKEMNMLQAHNKAADIVKRDTANKQKPDWYPGTIQGLLPGTLAIRPRINS